MSRSRNLRSKYAYVPQHVQKSLNTKASSIKVRSRDQRARDKQITRALINEIRES